MDFATVVVLYCLRRSENEKTEKELMAFESNIDDKM